MSGDFGQQQFQQQQFKHKAKDLAKNKVDTDKIKACLRLPAQGLFISGLISVILTVGGAAGFLVYGSTKKDEIVAELTWRMFGVDEEVESERGNANSKKAKAAKKKRDSQANAAMTLLIGGIIITGLILSSFYIFAVSGGLLMGQLRNHKVCRIACIIACIPILSPLLVVGIPFALIGLKKLSNREVKKTFT